MPHLKPRFHLFFAALSVSLILPSAYAARKQITIHPRCVELLTGSPINWIPLAGYAMGGHPHGSTRVSRSVDIVDQLIWNLSRKNNGIEVGSWEIVDHSGFARSVVLILGESHRISGDSTVEAFQQLIQLEPILESEILMIRARHNHPVKLHQTLGPITEVFPDRFSKEDREFSTGWRKRFDNQTRFDHVFFEDQITFEKSGRLKKEAYVLPPKKRPHYLSVKSIKIPQETKYFIYENSGENSGKLKPFTF